MTRKLRELTTEELRKVFELNSQLAAEVTDKCTDFAYDDIREYIQYADFPNYEYGLYTYCFVSHVHHSYLSQLEKIKQAGHDCGMSFYDEDTYQELYKLAERFERTAHTLDRDAYDSLLDKIERLFRELDSQIGNGIHDYIMYHASDDVALDYFLDCADTMDDVDVDVDYIAYRTIRTRLK